MKPLLTSLVLFVLVLGGLSLFGYAYMIEPGSEGRYHYIKTSAKMLLHKYNLSGPLNKAETKRLYLSTCSRKCHGTDVIDRTPRTALEWEKIVSRMGAPDRADLSATESRTIIEYLQRNHLSNVPTLLPDATMRSLKKHLWRLDFGESDLYFDIIYIPRRYRSLMPYLAFKSAPTRSSDSVFIVYVNTHSGIVPNWNLAEIVTIRTEEGKERKALGWEVLYEDGQQHHKQGILTFPALDKDEETRPGLMEMLVRPQGMRERAFAWRLPIPDLDLSAEPVRIGGVP